MRPLPAENVLNPKAVRAIESHFILYVADQARSRDFYGSILGIQARLSIIVSLPS